MKFSTRLLVSAALALGSAAVLAVTPTHLYELNGSLADSLGGPGLTAYGGSFTPSNYEFAANQGLSLSNVLGSVYTIDMKFALDDTNGYRKLIDFKNRSSDTGLYDLSSALVFFGASTGTSGVFANSQWAQLTLTRDASGLMTGYVNGVQSLQFSDDGQLGSFSGPAAIAHFFMDDLAVPGEASGGKVDYIAIYDSALSAAEVGQISAVPEPESYALMLAGLAALALWTRRRTR